MQIESIRLKNFKVFQDITLSDIPPFCVIVGANGTGKSTLFQVFGFLKDCLTYYRPPIESLEELHDVRERMRTEGPRWWVRPSTSNIVWMPTQF